MGDKKEPGVTVLDTERVEFRSEEKFPDLGPFPGNDMQLKILSAVEAGVCSFYVTKKLFTPQKSYFCNTCFEKGENVTLCPSCVKSCHLGHDVEDMFFQNMYCDCPERCDCVAGKLEHKRLWESEVEEEEK